MEALKSFEELNNRSFSSVENSNSLDELEQIRLNLLGKKGEITLLFKELGSLSPEAKKDAGAKLNKLRNDLEEQIKIKKSALQRSALNQKLQQEEIDLTLPINAGLPPSSFGSIHPHSALQRELEVIFTGLGFTVVDGPEVEKEYYNFDALNIPDTHPARDTQDTFWTTTGDLLRTHTSCMQIRALEKMTPPLRIVAPGRCFRYERLDASHEHTFYQMEGMLVDRKVTVGHLTYFLRTLIKEIFGEELKIRLRPGYFPFVEPGLELDIWFRGKWLELVGCGLVHPNVFRACGVDPNEWQGFAFGLGLSRLVMLRYGIDDIRHLMGCDQRFLQQFS